MKEIDFPNGFESWHETHYEVVQEIVKPTYYYEDNKVYEIMSTSGTGGLYEYAKYLTDKFELENKDRQWDGEFFDEIQNFLDREIYGD